MIARLAGRPPSGVLTLRFRTDGGPHTFDCTIHHDLPRMLEDIAFDSANQALVLTGTSDSFIPGIDGPAVSPAAGIAGDRCAVRRPCRRA